MLRSIRRIGITPRRSVDGHGRKTLSSRKNFLILENVVILSEAKDLLFCGEQQVLRFAQDDN